jgi:lysophospholipase L1-like esterase
VKKHFIIIHVGTNDINSHDKLSLDQIISYFNNLITVIRDISPTHIVFSSILPRPVDYSQTSGKVKLVNQRLEAKCKERKCQFVHSYRFFFHGGKPISDLFAVRDGGLHLNFEGTRRLRNFFIHTVSHLIKGKFAM